MPPPHRTVLHALGKWSRPCWGLILGVLPNSPIHTTSVVSSRPRFPGLPARLPKRGRAPRTASHLLEVLSVRVPGVGRARGVVERHFDEWHAALHQSAGQEATLSEQVAAVAIAELGFFFVQVNAFAAEVRMRRTARS